MSKNPTIQIALGLAFLFSQLTAIQAEEKKEAGKKVSFAVVRRCFELLLSRKPDPAELNACMQVAKVHGLPVVCRALINSNEFAFLP